MSTDLERQLARFAEALDREAPTIPFDDLVGRATVTVEVDLLERLSTDRAYQVDGAPWIDATVSHDEHGERDVLIELAPAVVIRRPTWWRVALTVAVAAAVAVVALVAIERSGDEAHPADFPDLTTTLVSPRNGFSIRHPDGVVVTPAEQLWDFGEQVDDDFDVVQTGLDAVFKGASTKFPGGIMCLDTEDEPIPCGSLDEQVDQHVSNVLPGGCGVPHSRQAEVTIDGRPGRVAECPNHIEATVVTGGRLYLFTLTHDRSDARAVFDAFVATVDLTPETAVDFPAMTTTFVSPTYGYSFKFHDRGGLAPATELWDPVNQPLVPRNLDNRVDGVETGLLAYFEAASTPIPDGVPIDEWVDEYVTPRAAGGCGVPRSEQAEITVDGQPGRVARCDHAEATVVAGGRLYLFTGPNDDRRWFEAWITTIDLTP
ncbi:MAG: hypothetical protein ACRDYW_07575, partial [Acidimicrobiales bacterium]